MRIQFPTGNMAAPAHPSVASSEAFLKSAEKETTATASDVMEMNGLKLGRHTELQVSNGASQFEETKTLDETKKTPKEIKKTPKKYNKTTIAPQLSDPPQKKLKLEDTSPVSAKVTTRGIATSPCHFKYLCRGQRYFNYQFLD
jgi:hypothetical protein